MEKKHVQTELSRSEYDSFRRASEKEGRTVKEALREAALAWARQRQARDDPLFQMVGIAKGPKHAAKRHDDVYAKA